MDAPDKKAHRDGVSPKADEPRPARAQSVQVETTAAATSCARPSFEARPKKGGHLRMRLILL
jgi:hypothetical protein